MRCSAFKFYTFKLPILLVNVVRRQSTACSIKKGFKTEQGAEVMITLPSLRPASRDGLQVPLGWQRANGRLPVD